MRQGASRPPVNTNMLSSHRCHFRALSLSCLILVLNLFHIGVGHQRHSHLHECGAAGSTTHIHRVHIGDHDSHHHAPHHHAAHHEFLQDPVCDSHLDPDNDSCCVVECLDQSSKDATSILRAPQHVALAPSTQPHLFAPVRGPEDVFTGTNCLVWPHAPPDRHLGRAPPCSTGFCSFRRATL